MGDLIDCSLDKRDIVYNYQDPHRTSKSYCSMNVVMKLHIQTAERLFMGIRLIHVPYLDLF